MVLVDEVVVKLLSSKTGISFIESLWLCDEYHTKQEAFQALTSILTRGKYTSSPKAWLKSKGVMVIFAQLAAVDVDLDPHPERDATHEHNPVNAPVNAPKHVQIKSRIPSRVSPISFSKGMTELGERWKHMEPDDIMSVAILIQGASKDGLIGKDEFVEFANLVDTVAKTQEYKNDPSSALEKLYVNLLAKKRQIAYNEFFAEWLSESSVEGSNNGGESNDYFYGAEGSKFYKNARTLKTIQFQLEEMAAQARSDGLRPLISFEHLLSKVRERGFRETRDGGIPHNILTKFLESIGASIAVSSSPYSSPTASSLSSRNESPFSFFSELMNGGHQSLFSLGPSDQTPPVREGDPSLPSFTFEDFSAPEGDVQAALKELQNNSAYISEKIATQARDLEFQEALKQFRTLGGGGGVPTVVEGTTVFSSLASTSAVSAMVSSAPEFLMRDSAGSMQSDIATRLNGLTVDTSWDRATGEGGVYGAGASSPLQSPRTRLSSSVSISTPSSSSSMSNKVETPTSAKSVKSITSASTTTSEVRKANLSIFKSPKAKTPQPVKKSPSDRLPVRLSACHGSSPATKAIISRAQKNRNAAEHAIVKKNAFK